MADYLTTNTELSSIANAIREKGGTSKTLLYPEEFVSAINSIEINPIEVTIFGGTTELISGTIEDYLLTMNGAIKCSV